MTSVFQTKAEEDIQDILLALQEASKESNPEIARLVQLLNNELHGDSTHIVREIYLPEDVMQIGIKLVHFVGPILTAACPNCEVLVHVTIQGDYLILTLEVDPKDFNTVSDTLEQYAQILQGNASLDSLIKEGLTLMRFKQVLDLSALELRITQELEMEDEDAEPEPEALLEFAGDISALHAKIGAGLSGVGELKQFLSYISDHDQKTVREAVAVLDHSLSNPEAKADRASLKQALAVIQKHEPELFQEIHTMVTGSVFPIRIKEQLESWAQALASLLPH